MRLLKNPIALIIITIITVVFYISLAKTQEKSLTTLEKIEKIETENKLLSETNKNLEEKLQNVDTEEIIRNDLLLKKPGEYVVKVPSLDTREQEKEPQTKEENLSLWLEIIF